MSLDLRADFRKLQDGFCGLCDSFDTLAEHHGKLGERHNALVKAHNQLVVAHNHLVQRFAVLERSMLGSPLSATDEAQPFIGVQPASENAPRRRQFNASGFISSIADRKVEKSLEGCVA